MDRYWQREYLPNNYQLLASKFFSNESYLKGSLSRNHPSLSRNGRYSTKIKPKSHTRNNSHLKKNKSKCQTEINLPADRRKGATFSKETIRKKNSSELTDKKFKGGKSSVVKTIDSKTIKPKTKKMRSSKAMFHSTSYSRQFQPDLQLQDEPILVNSELLCPQKQEQKPDKNSLQDLVQRTNRTLCFYKNKCQTLESTCEYYKNQLNLLVRKMERLKKLSKSKNREKGRKDGV